MNVGRYFGINVNIHWTWILAVVYFTFFASFGPPLASFIITLGIFLIVLLHELGHSLTAKKLGFQADSITLMLLGGVAWIGKDSGTMTWWKNFLISAAGPAVNVLIAGLMAIIGNKFGFHDFVGFMETYSKESSTAALTSYGLALYVWHLVYLFNIIILLFNLLPVFPLDGGQIAQSLFWGVLGLFRVRRAESISVMFFSVIAMIVASAGIIFFVMQGAIIMVLICGFIVLTSWAYFNTHCRRYNGRYEA